MFKLLKSHQGGYETKCINYTLCLMCVCIHVCEHTFMYVCECVCVCICVRVHVWVWCLSCVCMFARVCLCRCVCRFSLSCWNSGTVYLYTPLLSINISIRVRDLGLDDPRHISLGRIHLTDSSQSLNSRGALDPEI